MCRLQLPLLLCWGWANSTVDPAQQGRRCLAADSWQPLSSDFHLYLWQGSIPDACSAEGLWAADVTCSNRSVCVKPRRSG